MKRDLLVGVAQWLSAPGEPKQNLSVALGMMDDAAARGVELLVLPELWSCGYDPETLANDARRDAEPRDGPRARRLAERARRHGLFVAGSVPELGDDGSVHDTMLVFNPHGDLAAWHRKAHLYRPAREHAVFAPGDRVTTFDDPSLGRIGLVVGFEGDFPEVARSLALRGARLVLAACACEVEAAPAWDLLHPAYALANSQWWLEANQAGTHATSTLLGASRIIAPTGTVVATAQTAVPGRPSPAELVVHRIDLHLAHLREGVGALLEEERRPALYGELVERAAVI
ncbi:MAG TPA: carbon-nitrogen hydrolase family protein [Acidimicrobiales bacterium]|nr:carbon-nitrogen hydrolase family protein [Acidimicrobiales bacterium]